MTSAFGVNNVCVSFGSALSMLVSLADILSSLGLLPFSGVTLIDGFSVSMSVHFSLQASPQRMPVSLSSWRKVAIRWLHPPISWSTSFSVGMKGSFRMRRYSGGSHFVFCIWRKLV